MNADKQGRLISLQWLTSSVFCLAKARTSGTLGMQKGEKLAWEEMDWNGKKWCIAIPLPREWGGLNDKEKWIDEWMNDQARWDIHASVPSKRITFKGSQLMYTKMYSEGFIRRTSDDKEKKQFFVKECLWSFDQLSLRLVHEEGSWWVKSD